MTMIPYSLRKEMEAAAKSQRTPTSAQYRDRTWQILTLAALVWVGMYFWSL